MNVDGIKITIENPVNELLHCKNLLESIYVYDVYICIYRFDQFVASFLCKVISRRIMKIDFHRIIFVCLCM